MDNKIRDLLYTIRWYGKEVEVSPTVDRAKFLARELIELVTDTLGDRKTGEPRTNNNGQVVTEVPSDIQVSLPELPTERKANIYPYAKLDLDPDRNGLMPYGKPRCIVLHYTVSYDLGATVEYFKRNFVDVHFVVGHDGKVVQMVEGNRAAAHAGESSWDGIKGLNDDAIGIEIVSIGPLTHDGHGYLDCYNLEKKLKGKSFKYWTGPVRPRKMHGFNYWEPFSPEQEASAMSICRWAMKEYGIKVSNIIGHEECSPGRKQDPGGCLSMSLQEFRNKLSTLS